MIDIDLNEFDYDLPEERIAQYPLEERDASKLLVFDGERIESSYFRHIEKFLNRNSFLVFNNTRVIKARLLFRKKSGAKIEVLCLEPVNPVDYESSLGSNADVEWRCIVGNLKKWKSGALSLDLPGKATEKLYAEKTSSGNDTCIIRFSWNNKNLSFSEVVESAGHIPLPPYINRNDEPDDRLRYQTVYSRIKGSVAAPTAGLHFTKDIIDRISAMGIRTDEITLHVGAGTFQPVRSDKISGHEMHSEHFFVKGDTINRLIENTGNIIAVGTTSVRTLESLYWLGIKALNNKLQSEKDLFVDQWEPYEIQTRVSAEVSLKALSDIMVRKQWNTIEATTKLIIIPGYNFRIIDGMITNFHQPGSTLLLLVSAWIGQRWKEIYNYALENGFRFLSYGDSTFLFRNSYRNFH